MGDMTMNMKQLIKEFEEYRDDSNSQLEQLREEMQQLRRELSVKKTVPLSDRQRDSKLADIEFGKKLIKQMKQNAEHPYIRDRDVFTTWHMHIVVTSLMPDSESGLTTNIDKMLSQDSSPATRNELRVMCRRLVNSGMFITRKTQRYMPAMPEYEQKFSRRRHTAVIAGNFDKYKDLSESAMDKEMDRQIKAASALNYAMMQKQNVETKTTELDTGVSFL